MKLTFLILLNVILARSKISNDDDLLNNLIDNAHDNSKGTDELLDLLGISDVAMGTDEEDEMKDPEPDPEIDDAESRTSARAGIGSFTGKVFTKMTGGARKGLQKSLKKMTSQFRKIVNKVSSKGVEGWKKFKGAVKNPKAAGKKMMKAVVKDVYETGKEEALEYLKAALIEWIEQKIHDQLCECFYKKDKAINRAQKRNKKPGPVRKCRCCIKPPGFKRACLKMEAKIKTREFNLAVTWNGTEFLKTNLYQREEQPKLSKCSVPEVGEPRRDVCGPLPGYLHFIHACISPGDVVMDIEEDEEEALGFGACFQIGIGKLSLSFTKCLHYNFAERNITFVQDVEDSMNNE